MIKSEEISQEEIGLLRASKAGNLEKVKNYLDENVDINVTNYTGLNSLHLASKEGFTDVVQELINHGADVNSKTKKGNAPLHIACLAGQTKVVELLITNGADVNIKAQNGFTPLYMASQECHVDAVKLLLSHGANLHASTEDGFTALDVAVQQDHEAVVIALLTSEKRKGFHALHGAAKKDLTKPIKFLIQKGHSVDVRAPNGFTPLHIAAKYNSANAAVLLINSGANIDALTKTYAITPLHAAAKFGHANIATVLLQWGAKPDKPNRDGLTSLHCASREGHTTIVESLIADNATISARTKNGLTPLHMAVQGNHSKTITSLIDHGAPLNAIAVDSLCPIHIAAHYGHVEAMEALLSKGVHTDSRARNGFTALHIACKKNHEPVIHLLLKYGANINAVNEGGQTPMHVAAYYGNVSVVVMLLQNGGSPDVTNMRGETVLHIACRIRNINIVRLLLRNGAAVDSKTQSRETALHIAVKSNNVEMVRLLLDHGASVEYLDRTKCTPLHLAARNGYNKIVEALFEHKPPLFELNQKGFTPLHEAARQGHVKTVELLLPHYPSPDPPGKHGMTPLHVACHYDHVKVAVLLLDKNASKYAITKNGYTPLHIASLRNQNDVAATLLDYGVEPDTKTKSGVSPLHLAAKEGHVAAVSLLLEHGASPDVKTKNGLTPLHVCARYNKVDVAKLVLKYDAEINVQTESGFTPLHIACYCGHYEIAHLLLEHNANVAVITTQGYMPLHFAAQQGHIKIIELLLRYDAPPDAVTKDGFTALYIAQYLSKIITTVEWTHIIETLIKVTTTRVSTTALPTVETGHQITSSQLPEELYDDGSSEGTGTLEEDDYEYENRSQFNDEDYLRSFMPDVGGMRESITETRSKDHSARSTPDSSYRENVRGISSPLSPFESVDDRIQSQLFEDEVVVSTQSAPSFSFEASELDKLPADNIIRDPPVSGGFLVSFMVDARGCVMRSQETGIKMTFPPQSCRMPTRITCRLLKSVKPTSMPTIDESEGMACRMISLGPCEVKFIKPVSIEIPHFASLRNGERELLVIISFDGGQTWKDLAVENQSDVSYETQHVKISLTQFPGRMAVISRLKKETFVTGSKSEVIKSHVVQHCSVSIPEGAIRPGTVINMQVKPVDENFNDQQEGAAISPILKLSPSDVVVSRPLTISFPTPTYTLRREYEEAPEQHLLMQPAGKPGYEWQDVTLSTPLKIMNGCATFTTEEMGKYCLIDSYNEANVVNDTRLMCKKLNRVPYMAKFVVFAKISSNTTMVKFRVFCMTDDKVDKTLETQTGFTEVACSRNIEINNGQTIFFNCQGNVEADADCNLQMNFFAFRENRLPFIARLIDSNQQMKMKLLVILNPIRDQQGKIHVASALDIDLSADTIGRDMELQKISDNLLQLIAKQLNEDWNSFGEKIGLNGGKLQDILDLNGHNYEASAFEVVQIWRDEQGPDASLEKLESVLQAIGREDILKNFKHLTNSSYGTHDRLLVTEIHRNGDTKHTNRYVEGKNDILIDSSCEKSVEEKRYSGFLKDSTSNADREGNDDEKSKNIIEGMFSNDEEILRFFQDNVTNNTETEID